MTNYLIKYYEEKYIIQLMEIMQLDYIVMDWADGLCVEIENGADKLDVIWKLLNTPVVLKNEILHTKLEELYYQYADAERKAEIYEELIQTFKKANRLINILT